MIDVLHPLWQALGTVLLAAVAIAVIYNLYDASRETDAMEEYTEHAALEEEAEASVIFIYPRERSSARQPEVQASDAAFIPEADHSGDAPRMFGT